MKFTKERQTLKLIPRDRPRREHSIPLTASHPPQTQPRNNHQLLKKHEPLEYLDLRRQARLTSAQNTYPLVSRPALYPHRTNTTWFNDLLRKKTTSGSHAAFHTSQLQLTLCPYCGLRARRVTSTLFLLYMISYRLVESISHTEILSSNIWSCKRKSITMRCPSTWLRSLGLSMVEKVTSCIGI